MLHGAWIFGLAMTGGDDGRKLLAAASRCGFSRSDATPSRRGRSLWHSAPETTAYAADRFAGRSFKKRTGTGD